MKTVLVTGATGFAGSHVLAALATQRNLKVIAACRDENRLAGEFTGTVRVGDLRDAAYLESLLKGVDVVCHCAAWTSLYRHNSESRSLYLEPSLALVKVARSSGVRRIINTSTTSAAAPLHSADADSRGIPRSFWPHLCNVIAIEDCLRSLAAADFTVVNLRLGLFAGRRYALGLLPVLLPRLRTHLVPWVAGGRTGMPVIDGRDIGQAFLGAVLADGLPAYTSCNVLGPGVPTVREVIGFLHTEYGYPEPHFSVPFPLAFGFAWLMEMLDRVVPWEPLVTRSIVHLLRDVSADNSRACRLLGYRPQYDWRTTIRDQLEEMSLRQKRSMRMASPVSP